MTGKYSDPIAEAAEAILNDGFADDQCGTVEYGGEHYALVTLTADALAHTAHLAIVDALNVDAADDAAMSILHGYDALAERLAEPMVR